MEKRICTVCGQSFPNERSLGDHIRTHVVLSSPMEDEDKPVKRYGLRDNPKKSRWFDDVCPEERDKGNVHTKRAKVCSPLNSSDESYADEEIIRILTTRSKAQLTSTFNAYHNEFDNPINKDLKSDPKDHFLSALRAITKCITALEKYFEKAIRVAINNVGTDEEAVTRVIATRAELDLKVIKDLYYKRNSVLLVRAIKKDTRGDYEDFLVALLLSYTTFESM